VKRDFQDGRRQRLVDADDEIRGRVRDLGENQIAAVRAEGGDGELVEMFEVALGIENLAVLVPFLDVHPLLLREALRENDDRLTGVVGRDELRPGRSALPADLEHVHERRELRVETLVDCLVHGAVVRPAQDIRSEPAADGLRETVFPAVCGLVQ